MGKYKLKYTLIWGMNKIKLLFIFVKKLISILIVLESSKHFLKECKLLLVHM